MKIPVIKLLVETYSVEELKKAEEALLNEELLSIAVEGNDEGEQLTHVIAAGWIKDYIAQHNTDYKTALRAYTEKVRNSIN
jgi:hypothetical protein